MRRRWVVKAGSNLICEGGPILLRAWMAQVARLKKEFNTEIIWVTSGAIAMAKQRLSQPEKGKTLAEKQALSAIGQPNLMDLYNLSLGSVGLQGAQILLTYDDMREEGRKNNLQNSLDTLLSWDITPILNENDAVSVVEIQFGDNDVLSAKTAALMKADRLVILTDVEGLYDEDPRTHANATIQHKVESVTDELLAKVKPEAGTSFGTGGMYSKLKAAQIANESHITTFLVKGDIPNALIHLAQDKELGTQIGSYGEAK